MSKLLDETRAVMRLWHYSYKTKKMLARIIFDSRAAHALNPHTLI